MNEHDPDYQLCLTTKAFDQALMTVQNQTLYDGNREELSKKEHNAIVVALKFAIDATTGHTGYTRFDNPDNGEY